MWLIVEDIKQEARAVQDQDRGSEPEQTSDLGKMESGQSTVQIEK